MRFAVFFYEGTEPIDLATIGVLSMARRVEPKIEIVTVAPTAGIVELANGLQVISRYGIDDFPGADVLIVTGGPGAEAVAVNPSVQRFLCAQAVHTVIASVCTGALILAAAGLLNGRTATTKREIIAGETSPAELLARHPKIDVIDASVVDQGTVITGGGVTLCIDTTLYLLKRYFGDVTVRDVARILEYTRAWHANGEALPAIAPGDGACLTVRESYP